MGWFLLISVVLAAAWIPVLLFFFRNWKQRKNPISLAICGLVGFCIYTNLTLWIYCFTDRSEYTLLTMNLMEAAVIMFFYASLGWADHKFEGNRDKDKN